MKANAPERLYLSKNIYGTYLYQVPDPDDETAVEYTRTDAFIDKAKKWFEEHADDYNYTWYNEMEGESGITIECIEDFINYMKGE